MVAACVKHIVAQSIAWFYRPGTEPYREDAPLDVHASGLLGVSVEGVVALERSVLETSGVHGCVLRYGQLYGPGTYHPRQRPDEPRAHIDHAAERTVEALGARPGIVTIVD